MSSIGPAARIHHPCVRCTDRFEDMVQSRKNQNLLLPATTKMQRNVEILEGTARMVSGKGPKGRTRWALKEISHLLSKQFLEGWLLFLEDMCGETRLILKVFF